ncbi:filamentous hemagglutinin N-terminal domain-containing protein [Selenomonas ruminantium]|uniref:Filamentous hemagglutinin family N-terminal domain-containing protein n=1 Tax=Selenomonas ruminantium TaxID=971 RepID=A0A1I0YDV4_SELRU|nr:filamentous hemagglutinin N-terminal domain-containing protein [Selenomonas ruminantium]SFB11534.1 filamentous hemagglutinin family N-terminal domain-containing protein [Selenomonas ruminantium]
MYGNKEMRQIALQVSIALAAGMFSVVPVVHGAPVGGTSTTATITYSDAKVDNQVVGQNTSITSNVTNNVIDWQDFSVAAKETVDFDGNNYMNIVTGKNTSIINGAINGTGDIYIINPSGVVIGKGAEINTASFYASTRDVSVSDAVSKATAANVANSTDALSDLINAGSSTTGAAMDIVNMGNISATNVVLEGENIRLLNAANIQADKVTVRADDGYIHVGSVSGTDGTQNADTEKNETKYKSEALTGTGSAKEVEGYKLVYDDNTKVLNVDSNKWSNTLGAGSDLSGNYMLAEEIDLKDGAKSTVTGTFSNGKIDGNFFAVKNAKGDSGLFASTSNATIENIGIKDSEFTNATEDIGGVVSAATNTILKNVFNENSTVTGIGMSGGIVGAANNITMESSYNTGDVYDDSGAVSGAGLVGKFMGGTITINDCYSTGTTYNGVAGYIESDITANIERTYTKGTNFWDNVPASSTVNLKNSVAINTNAYHMMDVTGKHETEGSSLDDKSLSAFVDGDSTNYGLTWNQYVVKDNNGNDTNNIETATNITNTGGLARKSDGSLDTDSNGKIFRPTWRIYEGQSAPILTAFTKGIKTTTYDYAYYDNSGTKDTAALSYNNYNNGGKDMTAYTYTADSASATGYKNDGLVYNGETLKIVGGDRAALTSVDTSALFQKADSSSIDASHISYDTSGQRDATYSTTTGQGKMALIYSDQNGYDLVGNNIAIAPRQVTISDDFSSKEIVKPYDGKVDASSYVSQLFSGSGISSTGILPNDTSVGVALVAKDSGTDTTAKAVFRTEDGNGGLLAANEAVDKQVGANKKVVINGKLILSNGPNSTTAYTGSNYIIKDKDGKAATSVELTNAEVDAAITQRVITLSFKGDAISKQYDRTGTIKNADGTVRNFVADTDFTLTGTAATGDTLPTLDVSGLNADIQSDDPVSGYIDANKKYGVDDSYDVLLSGLKLGIGGDNYVLKDSSGVVVYSAKDIVTGHNATTTAVTTGNFKTTGAITLRQLSNTGYQWYYTNTDDVTSAPQDAAKEYDYRYEFDAPEDAKTDSNDKAIWYVTNAANGGNSGLLEGDEIYLTVDTATFWSTATPTTDVPGTGSRNAGNSTQGVKYHVKVTGDSMANYTFDGTTPLSSGEADVYGAGTITPRTIYVTYGSNANKEYDGDALVKYNNNSTFDLSSGYLAYADNNAKHQLLTNDGSTIEIEGTYQDVSDTIKGKDVYYDATNYPDNPIREKTINYTATIKQNGSASSNYQFYGTTSNITTFNEGEGKILQRQLGSLTIADVSKTYDGDEYVTNTKKDTAPLYTNDKIKLGFVNTDNTGIISSEKISDVFHVDDNGYVTTAGEVYIKGYYGDYNTTTGEFTPNANATENSQPNAHLAGTVAKVQYVGVEDLMKNHNYKLASSQGNTIYGEGTINRYLISNKSQISLDRNDELITKEYDGNKNIADAGSYLTSTQAKVTLSEGKELTGDKGLSMSVAGAQYNSKHSNNNTAQDVYYYITPVVTGNYGVDSSILETSGDYNGKVKLTLENGGLITQKHITANDTMLVSDNITKTYDSEATIAATGNALIDLTSQLTASDGVKNGITASYVKNTGTAETPNYVAEENASATVRDKSVKYTLALTDDNYNDYFIDDGTGSITVSKDNSGNITATKNLGATAFVVDNNGTINKRNLVIGVNSTPVKTYDGKSTVTGTDTDVKPTSYDDLTLDATTRAEDIAVMTKDNFNFASLTGNYGNAVKDTDGNVTSFTADGSVKRAGGSSTGDVEAKDVEYTGFFTALGTAAGNYTINGESYANGDNTYNTGKAYGTGTINPAAFSGSFVFKLKSGITQIYSGSDQVGQLEIGTSAADVDKFRREQVDEDSSGVYLTSNTTTGPFISLKNGGYSYTINEAYFVNGKDAQAGEVKYSITLNPASFSNYTDAPTSVTLDDTTTGEITKREVFVDLTTLASDGLTKNYDGNSKIYNNDNKAYSTDTATGTELTGSSIVTFAPTDYTNHQGLVAGDENASIGAYSNPDYTTVGSNKEIKYTAQVTEGDAISNNYIFKHIDSSTGTPVTTTLTNGQGVPLTTNNNTINAFGLEVTANPITKAYDGTENVAQATTTAALQLGDTVNGETVAFQGIDGDTGKYVGTHVDENGDGVPDTHIVHYSNLTLNNTNYKLVTVNNGVVTELEKENGKYKLDGTGTITPYKLLYDDVSIVINPATKQYNNDYDVLKGGNATNLTDNNYIADATVKIRDAEGNETGTQDLVFTSYEATYQSKNVADNATNKVTYKLGLSGSDYDLSDLAVKNAIDSQNRWLAETAGTITPRELTVVAGTGFRKIYDGDGEIDSATAKEKITFSPEDWAVLQSDGAANNIQYSVDASFTNKDANVDPNETKNGKTVNYTFTLTGNPGGNYSLAGATTANPNVVIGTTTGDIEKRQVTISLLDGNVADKEYDGSADAKLLLGDSNAIAGRFKLEQAAADSDTGIITGEYDEISLNTGELTATYANGGHVKRDSDGQVIADTVNFSNFKLTSTNADNPGSNYIITPTTLQGSGKITPRTITVDMGGDAPSKEYDGNTDIDLTEANENLSATINVATGDTVKVVIDKADFRDKHATDAGQKVYDYDVRIEDTNNDISYRDYELKLASSTTRALEMETSSDGQTAKLTGFDGTITPRTLNITSISDASKTYDGTDKVINAGQYINVDMSNVVTGDENKIGLDGVTGTYQPVTIGSTTYLGSDAGTAESDDKDSLVTHDVVYTLTLNNPDYVFATGSNNNGTGTIARKGLNIVATPVSVNVGDSVPASFNGSVQGLVKNNIVDDTGLADSFTFGPDGTLSTTTAGKYGIYGWYMGKKSGNFGRNYTFDQVPGNATAFTVNFVNNTDNPDTKITPTPDIYHKISKDMNSGFGDNDIAAIEYRNKKGTVIGTVTIDSGEVHNGGAKSGTVVTDLDMDNTNLGKIGIAGDDIVNMEGANAASNANIAVSGDGTTVNLEVYAVKDEDQSQANNAVAEITATDSKTGTASIEMVDNAEAVNGGVAKIELLDEKSNLLGEENEDKVEKEEKEGKIAIKSNDGQDEDEIELTIEKEGVNVA